MDAQLELHWRIEQLFATLKLAGLDLEATQLESISAIQRLTILALSVAVRTLQMVDGRDNVVGYFMLFESIFE